MRRTLCFLLIAACQSSPSASTPTLVEDFELANGTVAMLLQGTPRTQFGDLVSTPALRNFKKRWALVVKHRGSRAIVAETMVADLPGDTLEKPWHRRSGDRLWVWDTHQLLLFDLATAKLLYKQSELPAQQAVFTPPIALYERKTDRKGALIVRDRQGRYFRVDADLKATATDEATIENEWREIEYDELHGCATKTRWSFRGNDRKGVVDLTHVKHHGKDIVDEDYLEPTYFVDHTRHCLLDGAKGPLVFSRDNLAATSPLLLAHVDGKNSKHLWQIVLNERCGAKGMPAFARETSEHVTLVFASGAACQITLADGVVTWKKSAAELVAGATKLGSARNDGDAVALWLHKSGTDVERVTIGKDGSVLDRLTF